MPNHSTSIRVASQKNGRYSHKELFAKSSPSKGFSSKARNISISPNKRLKSPSNSFTVKQEIIDIEDDDDDEEAEDNDFLEQNDDDDQSEWKRTVRLPTDSEMAEFENSITDLDRIEKKIDFTELFHRDDLPREKNMEAIVDDRGLISEAPLHELVPKLYVMKQSDKELVVKHNLKIQSGRFSKMENSLLTRNWLRFLEDYIVPDPLMLFGFFKRGENRSLKLYYTAFTLRTKFLLRLGLDLPNRTLYQIYCRGRALLSGLKKARDFTPEDREMIIEGHRIHGDQYVKFCEEPGLNPKAAREVIRNVIKPNGNKLNSGTWSADELGQLKESVQNIIQKYDLKNYDGIPWTEVAASMKRSDVQCRQRFFSKVVFMLVQTNAEQEVWDEKFDMARLIALMNQCDWSDDTMIDWDFLKEKFSIECFNILSRSWRVARTQVPDYHNKALKEILNHLYESKVIKPFGRKPSRMRQINDFVEEAIKDL